MPKKLVSFVGCLSFLFFFLLSTVSVYADELEFSPDKNLANQTEVVTFTGSGGTPDGVFTLWFTNSNDEMVWAVQDTFSVSGDFEYEIRIPLDWQPGIFTVFLRDYSADSEVSNDIIVSDYSFPLPVAIFELSNLLVNPSEVTPDEEVTVSVTVSNVGEIAWSYTVELLLDYETIDTQTGTLDVGYSTTVSFGVASDIPGTHILEIGELMGGFNVVETQYPINPWVIVDLSAILIAIGGILYLRKTKML